MSVLIRLQGGPSAAELQVLIKDKKYNDIMTQLTSFYNKTTSKNNFLFIFVTNMWNKTLLVIKHGFEISKQNTTTVF